MTAIAKPQAPTGKLIETSREDEAIARVMNMTEEERTRLSTINDTIQRIREEAFPQIAAIKRTVSFKETTELYEPDLNTPDMGKAPPKETPLREEANTHPTCPYNPIQLTQTPLQGSHKKGLAFTTKTDELIFNGLAARAEIGYKAEVTYANKPHFRG